MKDLKWIIETSLLTLAILASFLLLVFITLLMLEYLPIGIIGLSFLGFVIWIGLFFSCKQSTNKGAYKK